MQASSCTRSLSGVFAALLAGVVALSLAGCASQNSIEHKTSNWTTNRIYNEARDERLSGGYDKAVELYNVLEGRAAGTTLAQQAQLEKAYAQYQNDDIALAKATLDRFIALNKGSPGLDYAYYLKGVISFSANIGWLSSLTKQDLTERDQQAAKEAFDAFKEVLTRFPQSRYASDARQRMVYLANTMSESELAIADYYYRQGAYVAAINRAQSVITNYDGTPSMERALALLAQCYEELGMEQPHDDALRVLEKNFPESQYLHKPYTTKTKSWWKLW